MLGRRASNRTKRQQGSHIRVALAVLNLDVGGLEKVVIDLINNMDRDRFTPSLYCLGDGGVLAGDVRDSGCAVHAFHKKDGLAPGLPFRMRDAMRAEGVEVVHCHNVPALLYAGPAGKMARVAGVIYTPHGLDASTRREVGLYRRFGWVDRVIAISEDTRELSIGKSGFSPGETEVVVNGIDVDKFLAPLDLEEKRAELDLPQDRVCLGIVARLVPEKDHANLLDAMAILVEQCPDVLLVIVGDGELRDVLEAQAAQLELGDRVRFLGVRHDVDELLRIMDIFVLSSCTEGLSITLLEAMAAGLPIAATDVGGNAEVVVDGETGMIVPPRNPARLAEAIKVLVDDMEVAKNMGKMGRKRVEAHFSVTKMVNKYESAYEALVG